MGDIYPSVSLALSLIVDCSTASTKSFRYPFVSLGKPLEKLPRFFIIPATDAGSEFIYRIPASRCCGAGASIAFTNWSVLSNTESDFSGFVSIPRILRTKLVTMLANRCRALMGPPLGFMPARNCWNSTLPNASDTNSSTLRAPYTSPRES